MKRKHPVQKVVWSGRVKAEQELALEIKARRIQVRNVVQFPRFFLTAPLLIIQRATKQHLPTKADVFLEENASPKQKSLEVTQLDATTWPALGNWSD